MATNAAARAFLALAEWASSGDTSSPGDEGYTVSSGWDASYSTVGGSNPEREVFNWLLRGIQQAIKAAADGALDWHSEVDFAHPSICWGSDNRLYASVKASGPATSNAVDPTADTMNGTWKLLLPDASTTVKGLSQRASSSDVTTGTENTKFVTSKNLKDEITDAIGDIPSASTTVKGLVELATTGDGSEARTGTNTSTAVTPAGVLDFGDNRYSRTNHTHTADPVTLPDASTTVKGVVELATTGADSEVRAGMDTTKAVTPAGLRDAGDDRYSLTSHTHTAEPVTIPDASTTVKGVAELATTGSGGEARAGTDTSRIMTPAAVRDAGDSRYSLTAHTHTYPSASETQRGDVELATEAEAKAGTDDARAITPETLRAAGDDRWARKGGTTQTITISYPGTVTGWRQRTSGQLYTILHTGSLAAAPNGIYLAAGFVSSAVASSVQTGLNQYGNFILAAGTYNGVFGTLASGYPYSVRKVSNTEYRIYIQAQSQSDESAWNSGGTLGRDRGLTAVVKAISGSSTQLDAISLVGDLIISL